MKRYFYIVSLIIIMSNLSISLSQENYANNLLTENDNDKSFVSDGQDHILYLKNNITTKVNAIFYPNFNYRIALFPENKNLSVEIKLLDQYGRIQYTNANKKYIKEWNFSFQSLMYGTIELKLLNDSSKKEKQVHLAISYQYQKQKNNSY